MPAEDGRISEQDDDEASSSHMPSRRHEVAPAKRSIDNHIADCSGEHHFTVQCSAMGRTKGLCDAANQLEEIFHGWKFMRYSHERREPQAVAFDRVKLPAVEEQRSLEKHGSCREGALPVATLPAGIGEPLLSALAAVLGIGIGVPRRTP